MDKFSLSERSLQRIFREEVGLSPKKIADIVKFENCISLFRSGKSLTDICYEAGYYDQPHFIKTFKQFTGLTPSQYSTLECSMPVCRFYTIN
jgi:AraC-like DNA-binding protein